MSLSRTVVCVIARQKHWLLSRHVTSRFVSQFIHITFHWIFSKTFLHVFMFLVHSENNNAALDCSDVFRIAECSQKPHSVKNGFQMWNKETMALETASRPCRVCKPGWHHVCPCEWQASTSRTVCRHCNPTALPRRPLALHSAPIRCFRTPLSALLQKSF